MNEFFKIKHKFDTENLLKEPIWFQVTKEEYKDIEAYTLKI